MPTGGPYLDFEKPLAELEARIEDMRSFSNSENIEVNDELVRLEAKADKLRRQIYGRLTRWQQVQLARHPGRPYTADYIELIFGEFLELHGDRLYGDDPAIIGGMAELEGMPVMVVGHQKGRETKEKMERNFGMPNPEGYRKALRLMETAARFGRPIITFVDTPGAHCGLGAEERGQGEAIARNLREMALLPVPIIVVITGEGGSGGALALAVGDRVLMMEHSVYSVITPEGCASILWNDSQKRQEAADAMKMTSRDLAEFEVVDRIITEPLGGAHRDPEAMATILSSVLKEELTELQGIDGDELVERRIAKFARMGVFQEEDHT
ncbi:MAG: acetyl-CoA carboxylase carboxyltransferase subunit alpha [bacterium]|nr:acetyl-CoA carboxylase carboxyltransferase subunit alpha [bacterium]